MLICLRRLPCSCVPAAQARWRWWGQSYQCATWHVRSAGANTPRGAQTRSALLHPAPPHSTARGTPELLPLRLTPQGDAQSQGNGTGCVGGPTGAGQSDILACQGCASAHRHCPAVPGPGPVTATVLGRRRERSEREPKAPGSESLGMPWAGGEALTSLQSSKSPRFARLRGIA